jgi:ribosomal protein S4
MNISSYVVNVGDVISMKKSRTAKIPQVAAAMEEERAIPNWLELKGTSIKIVKLPIREDIVEKIDEQLIVEYYNR